MHLEILGQSYEGAQAWVAIGVAALALVGTIMAAAGVYFYFKWKRASAQVWFLELFALFIVVVGIFLDLLAWALYGNVLQ